jgi:hypothetical protein
MAKQSGLETDRRAWLEVAQLWAFLLHQSRFADAATASSEQFDAQKRQLGTGQEKPDASHWSLNFSPSWNYRANHARHVSANLVLASSRVAQKPCDGSRGATTAPVMVQCQGRSSGTPPPALKMRPMSRHWASITS